MRRKASMRARVPALRKLVACASALLALSASVTFSGAARADVDAGKVEYYDAMSGVKLVALSSAASSGGMVVNADFANATNTDQNVYYRAVWLDASGQPVDVREAWKVVRVKGHSDQTVALTIDNGKVAGYRLQVSLGQHF